MQKNNLLISLISSILLSSFASAQFYGSVSLGSILSSIDPSTIVLGLLFIIFFVVIKFSLGKVFKGNESISGTLAFAISLLMVWGINQSGFNYSATFGNIFFFLPTGFLEAFWPLLLLVIWIFLSVKNGFAKGSGITMIGIGTILALLGITGNLYEQGFSVAIGVILIIVGLIFYSKNRDKKEFKFSI